MKNVIASRMKKNGCLLQFMIISNYEARARRLRSRSVWHVHLQDYSLAEAGAIIAIALLKFLGEQC